MNYTSLPTASLTAFLLFCCMVLSSSQVFAEEDSWEDGKQSQGQDSSAWSADEPSTSEWGDDDWGEDAWSDSWSDSWSEKRSSPLSSFHGFMELGASSWISSGTNRRDGPLKELRWRLEWERQFDAFKFNFSGDAWHDHVTENDHAKLRETNVQFNLGSRTDVKLGRQILTWGTGDLLFINDLFPKDWRSFFSGRDDEYLKAPSDAAKFSVFHERANLDLVLMPQFDSDESINGERFSFYLPGQGIAQPRQEISARRPDSKDWEAATRIYGNHNGIEWAVYGYRGFYKSPNAVNGSGELFHARLNSYGASIRSNLAGGIGNLEVGRYLSVQDREGTKDGIPNSQVRLLAGYEHELVRNLTGGFQFYVEKTEDFKDQQVNSLRPDLKRSEWYELITTRLTHLAFQQNLVTSLFLFYSPDEKDAHLRLKSEYRFSDQLKVAAGLYLFDGKDEHTFWSQFQDNDSVWLRLRYSY